MSSNKSSMNGNETKKLYIASDVENSNNLKTCILTP